MMEKYQHKIGCLVHIPNVGRGQLKYIGPVDTKPGIYVGVDLLANIGKNDGSFKNKKYFHTEFPQSGLFIQLQKVASLIDNAQPVGSRRSTLVPEPTFESEPTVKNRISSSESTGSTIVRRPIHADPKSPTPMREGSFGSATESTSDLKPRRLRASIQENKTSAETDYDGDLNMIPPSSVSSQRGSTRSPSPGILKEYELKIERQEREILQFKRLLDDQRMVLEEIQPTIDEYESNLREMEAEMNTLRHRLKEEQEQQQRQKQFFETEHEQLLAVVDELHEEIKANERRVVAAQSEQTKTINATPQSKRTLDDLIRKIEYYESAQVKWMKEKEQLKLQNDSLSAEYQSLNSEMLKSQRSGDDNTEVKRLQETLNDANMRIAHMQELLNQKNHLRSPTYADDTHNTQNSRSDTRDSLPLYTSKLKASTSTHQGAWCALCEKDGHESIECPYELPLVSDRPVRIRSSSDEQLLF